MPKTNKNLRKLIRNIRKNKNDKLAIKKNNNIQQPQQDGESDGIRSGDDPDNRGKSIR